MSETVSDPVLARLNQAFQRLADATKQDATARAEWARLELLKIADANPGVESFSFEAENESDYEGGYFTQVLIYTEWSADSEQSEFTDGSEDEILEIANMLNELSLDYLGYSKTIDQLREVRF